jgi:serine/alanine adding enzyme
MPDNPNPTLINQLKKLKTQKGDIARHFKTAVKGSTEHQILLEQMKSISLQIDEIEAAIKNSKNQTDSHTQNTVESDSNDIAFNFLEPNATWENDFRIDIVEGPKLDRWQDYLKHHQHTPYHQPEWLKLIQSQFRHPTLLLIAVSDKNEILGGMPLILFSSKLFGRFAVSIPYINYGGPISAYKNISQALIHHSKTLLDQFNLSHIEIRSIQAELYPIYTAKKASMILQLPETDEALEKDLGSKLRAQYKKAEEYSPKLNIGKTELLDDFYQVFARNMRDLGTPVYPKSFFCAILNEPTIHSTLIIVRQNNKPVSAAFLIGNRNTLEIPWASTISEANKQNMNMWMYRQILKYAIDNKFDFFDFGRSTIDAGTYKFKKQWGALPRQHYWYYIMPENQTLPEINPNNPKYKIFISLWKLMPVWLSKIVGPFLIRHIP